MQTHAELHAALNLSRADAVDRIALLARRNTAFRDGLLRAIREADRGIGGTGTIALDPPARPAPVVPSLAQLEVKARVDALPGLGMQLARGALIVAGIACERSTGDAWQGPSRKGLSL